MSGQRRFIEQFVAGEGIDQVFLVRDKDLRTTKSGGLYISCTLADRTGTMPARMWQATESLFNGIPAGGFLHVKGRCEDYKGSLQFIIDACRPVPAEKVTLGDYIPVSPFDIEEMWSELLEILREIKHRDVRLLIKKFVEDLDRVEKFKRSPAAMVMHQPYVGGLLEHTLNMARAARALLPLYPDLNADLILAGVFLHDIGKTEELTSGTNFVYTDRGQLVGHITMAAMWVQQKADAISAETGEAFPQHIVDLLQHLILSHHGVHEYGSPKLPMIPEAFFLHYVDNLDAKVWMTLHAVHSDPDESSNFTPYLRQLEAKIYKNSGEL